MKYVLVAALCLTGVTVQAADKAKREEFFETRIRPVLSEHCVSCHGAKKQQGGLRLDRREAVTHGADGVPVIVPGDPEKSSLLHAVRQTGDIKMPPKGKLSPQALADLATWVKDGAYWPEERAAVKSAASPNGPHWAFQPVRKAALPALKNRSWPTTAVDAFILAGLEAKRLTPSPLAERQTLLRRLKFDLHGLPANYEEAKAFEADASPDAYEKLVDRLLASPHYGERWARHWLDIARYADTKGYVFQEERRYPYAYAYRDYIVKALNDDLPYDQFILQQLAADRLVAAGQAPATAQAAMGFLTLGRRFLNNIHDIIDDRIDVVGRGLLGLTVACARCHDHKYDPIPAKDYYSLYGVFASSVEPKELPLLGEPERTEAYIAFETKLKELKNAVVEYQTTNKSELAAGNRKFRDGLRALQKKVDALQASATIAPPRAMVLQDLPTPQEPHVFLRGNPANRGPAVPRQFLAVLAGPKRQPFTQGSGRLELARAIASADNPLTARVLVNRVWMYHFGAGLVTSPSNFGVRSDPPSHPELLDYLAARFMEEGWSLKKLHRLILLSKVYQLSTSASPQAEAVDPENRLLGRANRQRLDFESMRDSLLACAGNLDLKAGGAAVNLTATPYSGRRTLYGFIDRQNLPGLFRTFDFASPDSSTAQRFQTTVPQQALYLLNNPFVHEQARSLVRRAEIAGAGSPAEKIQALYRIVYARDASLDEVYSGRSFIEGAGSAAEKKGLLPWERYAQVLLLSNEFSFID
jgi:mono/diheme cytochrome c family protein